MKLIIVAADVAAIVVTAFLLFRRFRDSKYWRTLGIGRTQMVVITIIFASVDFEFMAFEFIWPPPWGVLIVLTVIEVGLTFVALVLSYGTFVKPTGRRLSSGEASTHRH